jgi:hypothetical protein
VGFDDHKQEVFNLVQALKTLFLYSQNDKETVEPYGRNFRALWETVEAFGGSPGIHQGMIDAMLKDPTRVANVARPTATERKEAEDDATEAVKAALLISGADKMRFGRLKDELANNKTNWPTIICWGRTSTQIRTRRLCASLETTRQAGRAGHTEETAPKVVSHSSSEEEEDADAEVAEEVQGVARQRARQRMQAQETLAPQQQDRVIKRTREAASKSIEQETLIATTVGKRIIGRTNART